MRLILDSGAAQSEAHRLRVALCLGVAAVVPCAEMASGIPEIPSPKQADRTRLGVAPRYSKLADTALGSPVFVLAARSSPMSTARAALALPIDRRRPWPRRDTAPAPIDAADYVADGVVEKSLRLARLHPALWMVLAPAVMALAAIGIVVAFTPARQPEPTRNAAAGAAPATKLAVEAPSSGEKPLPALSELEAKPPESLSAHELLRLAEARELRRVADAKALRERVESNPELLADKAVQAELLRLARDVETSHAALAALSTVETALAADLLYEVWTGTSLRSESTELARALALSTDVRPRRQPRCRWLFSCEQPKAANTTRASYRRAQRRRIAARSACWRSFRTGAAAVPKKSDDCYACLRASRTSSPVLPSTP